MKIQVSGDAKFVQMWRQIQDEHAKKERLWIEQLRAQGFKAAHPNDGWVDREDCSLMLVYPQFNDGVGIGSKVMLGQPWDKEPRPIILTSYWRGVGGALHWSFEDIRAEKPSFWKRLMGRLKS